MPLASGARLGQYQIVEPIGAGGMGEVYRARDTKLEREVAIKVLPDELSKDAERLSRFEREAKLLAALNHPNVATLYGFEDGYLVMELVEGDTLAEQIARGPISVDEALPLFIQIAEGLEAAHEKGIIHRDLKPANIKVTPEGKVKILDFGLAKAFAPPEAEVDDSSQSPTLTRGTALGAIMGTASYMSPEQARGKSVDKRTDIWAFGCCLYEALTGRKAFRGENASDIIARVIEREPQWRLLPPETSPKLRELLARCLEKDRRLRKQSIGDTRTDLERMGDEPGSPVSEPPERVQAYGFALVAFAGGVVGSLLTLLVLWSVRSNPSAETIRTSINLPSGQTFNGLNPTAVVNVSADGRDVVYASEGNSFKELYGKSTMDFEPGPIEGTEGGQHPFYSPDGRWIAFFADGELRRVPHEGGAHVHLATASRFWEGTWTDRDTILYGGRGGIVEIPADGGEPVSLSRIGAGVTAHRRPQLLPGGRHVLLTIIMENRQAVALLDLNSGSIHELFEGAGARYAESGHLVFGRGSSLWAVPFDGNRMEIAGQEAPVLPSVQRDGFGTPQFGLSRDGTLVYVPAGLGTEGELVLADRAGQITRRLRKLSAAA